MDIMNSQSNDEGEQTDDQAEDLLQAKEERDANLSIDIDRTGAIDATVALMIVETDTGFLQGRVSTKVWPRKLAITHDNNVSDEANQRGGSKTTSKTIKGGGTNVDCSGELDDGVLGAGVVVAIVELGNDYVDRAGEDLEDVLDLGDGSLADDIRDSAGEGHSTGGEDSEDGRETHGEEAWEGYFGWERLEVSVRDPSRLWPSFYR